MSCHGHVCNPAMRRNVERLEAVNNGASAQKRLWRVQENQLTVVEAGAVPRLVRLIGSSPSDDQVRAFLSACIPEVRCCYDRQYRVCSLNVLALPHVSAAQQQQVP